MDTTTPISSVTYNGASIPLASGTSNELLKGILNGTITSVTAKDLDGVTKITPSLFESNRNLTSVELSSTITEIGDASFLNCTNITDFLTNDALTNIGKI